MCEEEKKEMEEGEGGEEEEERAPIGMKGERVLALSGSLHILQNLTALQSGSTLFLQCD